jgi:hypothetical protein
MTSPIKSTPSATKPGYEVAIYLARGTQKVGCANFPTLARATVAFQTAAKAHIFDRSACVMLVAVTPDHQSVLASKSVDAVHVEFSQAFYRAETVDAARRADCGGGAR